MFEENKKRAHWKTAVVEKLITGRNEIVRGAEVRTIAKGKHTLKTGVFDNTPRCILVHTKVCTIAHKGV